jgi:hypothetical protein
MPFSVVRCLLSRIIAPTERYYCAYALLWEHCCIATNTCRLVLLRIGYRCSQCVGGFHGRLPHHPPPRGGELPACGGNAWRPRRQPAALDRMHCIFAALCWASWRRMRGPDLERLHWMLKAAIMCHADQHWTEAFPLVLLGIRTSFKVDLQVSVAKLMYGEPLGVAGELLTPNPHPVEPAHLITQLRPLHMARLRPVPATRHSNPGTFIHKDLTNCTHVFHRQDSTRRALEPPYSEPYQVLSRKNKTLKLVARQTHHRVCRQGQACLHIQRGRLWNHYFQACHHCNPNHNTFWNTTTAFNNQNYTLRTPCQFSRTLHLLSINLRGGGGADVGASHGILPHVANIDNRSATVLVCKCSLLCNNIPIATHTRNSTAPSLLWCGLVNSAQQRTTFSKSRRGSI